MTTSMPKQLLLAVSGMSPQVITETLYGIATQLPGEQNGKWPDELRIVTTKLGKAKIEQALIHDGWLQKLCIEVDKPLISLCESDILTVPGAHGKPVVDARSADDHEALADFITTTVRDLTAEINEDNTPRYVIHASIAGGRKTMTFYLGYAISLFGRHFDRMSHVLVSEGYEGVPDFFFPTSNSQPLASTEGKLDACNAEVTLADIPFIRIRHSLPELLIKLGEDINYRQLVSLINLGDQPGNIRLLVNTQEMNIQLLSERYPTDAVCTVPINNPVTMAFYLLFIEDTRQNADTREIYSRPMGDDEALMMNVLLVKLEQLLGSEETTNSDHDIFDQLIEEHGLTYPNLERTLKPLLEKGGLDKNRFNNYLTNLRETLAKALPANLISLLLPCPLFDPDSGEICRKSSRTGGLGYGLNLGPHQIQICSQSSEVRSQP